MNRLVLALALTAGVAALEFWGGYRAHSLALTTDAVHVCMDVLALALALAASIGGARPANARKTFGYGRLEILGAVVNGAILLAVTLFIIYEALRRFFEPHHSQGGIMTAVAGVGLFVNVLVATTLSHQARENLNVRAALYHIFGDALGAAAVIVGGAVIALTSATWIDPLLSLFISAIIIIGVVHVLRESTDVLLEGVPRGMQPEKVIAGMQTVSGVVGVHDLHIWTIGTGSRALAAHVMLEDRRISEATAALRELEGLLRERFGIAHVTLQFECDNCAPGDRVVCTQTPVVQEAVQDRP